MFFACMVREPVSSDLLSSGDFGSRTYADGSFAVERNNPKNFALVKRFDGAKFKDLDQEIFPAI